MKQIVVEDEHANTMEEVIEHFKMMEIWTEGEMEELEWSYPVYTYMEID